MPLTPGTRLGPYEVTAKIGAGGMGEVYKATDTRLSRTVAIKVLPDHLAHDPDRLARFQREAHAISSLNHPHVCALHDVGDERGIHFLVMEYVEGDSLADRIALGPVRTDDAVKYATQIADALKTAHERGIVHRDLKPGNVMITASGVKLLDFGLAKFSAEATSGVAVSRVTTVVGSQPLTDEGTILGTLRYMAPEQLEGREVDARTDLYALCVVLYEMITGRWLFEGKTQASVIAAILKDRPRPLTDFQPVVPALLDRVLQTGLDKDPDRRWQSARELEHALEWIQLESPVAAPEASTRVSWFWKSLVAILAVALAGVILLRRPASSDLETRLEIWTGETADPAGFAVSPDGRRLTYVASGPAGNQLWLRSLGADRAEPLAQTLGASHPFWSPDNRSIGFFAERQLKRLDLVSRVTTPLATAPSPYGGAWGADTVLYTPLASSTLLRIPAGGGEPTPALPQGGPGKLFPVFLDGGPAFLFQVLGRQETHLARLGSKESKLLLRAVKGGLHPSGHMLFVRQGALLAQRFDLAAGTMVGSEVAVADGVLTSSFGEGTGLSVSASGVVAYRRGQTSRQLAVFDRSGQLIRSAGRQTSDLRWPAISVSGRIAFQSIKDGQVWLIDTAMSAPTQFTFGSGAKVSPLWSPDGQWLAFTALADGSVRRKRANGTGDEEVLLRKSFGTLSDWYRSTILRTDSEGDDIEVLSLEGDRKLLPYLANPGYVETRGMFSPNGKWVAYESNESGRFEIYVRPFPNPSGGQSKVSSDGGSFARWSRDGRELYYLSPAGALTAVPVNIGGDVFSFDAAHELFRTRIPATEMADVVSPYNVSADGRFLMRVPGDVEVSPITVLLNWVPRND